jgi:hypothetical protein
MGIKNLNSIKNEAKRFVGSSHFTANFGPDAADGSSSQPAVWPLKTYARCELRNI